MAGASSEPDPGAADTRAEKAATGSLFAAALLAFTGGTLDAFLYLTHDKVFAGAMTGNAVLCGIALLSHKGGQALHHLNPLFAFVCGVWTAEAVQERVQHHAVTIALGCEAVGVLLAALLGQVFPGDVFVFLLAFLSAFQVSTVRKTGDLSYNSTFITGNTRNAVVGLYKMLNPKTRADGMKQARALWVVILSFMLGAVGSALLAPRFGNRTLLLPFVLLLTVFVVGLRRSLSDEDSKTAEA